MGKLIDPSRLPMDESWYFITRHNLDDYPESCAIHQDHFGDRHPFWLDNVANPLNCNALKVAIRRFVERELTGDVIFTLKECNYHYVPSWVMQKHPDRTWGWYSDTETQRHGYHVFRFELVCDAVAFALRFADYVGPIEDRHPGYRHTDEEINAAKAR